MIGRRVNYGALQISHQSFTSFSEQQATPSEEFLLVNDRIDEGIFEFNGS